MTEGSSVLRKTHAINRPQRPVQKDGHGGSTREGGINGLGVLRALAPAEGLTEEDHVTSAAGLPPGREWRLRKRELDGAN